MEADNDSPEAWIDRGRNYVKGYIEQAGLGFPLSGYLLVSKGLDGEPLGRNANLGIHDVENVGRELFLAGLAEVANRTDARAVVFVWVDRAKGLAIYTGRAVTPEGTAGPTLSWIAEVSEAEGVTRVGPWEELPLDPIGVA